MSVAISIATRNVFAIATDKMATDGILLSPCDKPVQKLQRINSVVSMACVGNVGIANFVCEWVETLSPNKAELLRVEDVPQIVFSLLDNVLKQVEESYPLKTDVGFLIAGENHNREIETICIPSPDRSAMKALIPEAEQVCTTVLSPSDMDRDLCSRIILEKLNSLHVQQTLFEYERLYRTDPWADTDLLDRQIENAMIQAVDEVALHSKFVGMGSDVTVQRLFLLAPR